MSTADEDRISVRRAEAIRLRVQGKTIREIAKGLGISVSVAHSDVTAAMAETVKAAHKNADTERAVSLERIDRAIEVCMGMVDGGDLLAIDRLAKLEDRRAKLLGLDAPERHELDALISEATPEQAARLVREKFGDHALRGAPDGEPPVSAEPERTSEP